jgi:phage tail-like protein
MQVPEAVPTSELALSLANAQLRQQAPPSATQSLQISPGEPSELIVQVQNDGADALEVTFQVSGDFPADWCRIGTEGTELRSRQVMDAVLYFAIAPDYFEQHLSVAQLPLQLDYSGQLMVTLVNQGTGRRHQEMRPFQLYIRPRSLYLNFLPDLYRDIDFVGRFLAIFEQAFEPTVNTLDSLWAYLDPLTAPNAMLPFLSHWVGWSFQAPVAVERQRFLIRYAMQIYRWRGTRRGLRFFLHLATGLPLDEDRDEQHKHIGIHENFSQGFVLGVATIGEDATLGGNRPYHFTICLRPEGDYPIHEPLVRSIIEQEKPAFCTYDLHIQRTQLARLPPPHASSPELQA